MFGHSRRKRARKLKAANGERALNEIRTPEQNQNVPSALLTHGQRKRARQLRKTQASEASGETALNEIRGTEPNYTEQERTQDSDRRAQALKNAAHTQESRRKAELEGRADTQAFLTGSSVRGLEPEQRNAMQHEAERAIDRQEQLNMRELLGEQSRRGIVGKGGVGYAQQRNLQNLGQEQRGRVQRDLTRLDKDLELKKKAAIFAGGKGEAAQHLFDQQSAIDELELQEEKRNARKFQDDYRKMFNVRL